MVKSCSLYAINTTKQRSYDVKVSLRYTDLIYYAYNNRGRTGTKMYPAFECEMKIYILFSVYSIVFL